MTNLDLHLLLSPQSLIVLLLYVHVLSGFVALCSALGAISSSKGGVPHRFFGKVFLCGMSGVFFTAIPLALIIKNLFLFLIALLSYYFALSGWRFAKNRLGQPLPFDWILATTMLLTSFIMLGAGLYYNYATNQTTSLLLLIFGSIGLISSITDLLTFRNKTAIGKQRIVKHLSAMLGATIAASTAFMVTNIHMRPTILLWIGPTVLFSPLISWWKRKILTTRAFNEEEPL